MIVATPNKSEAYIMCFMLNYNITNFGLQAHPRRLELPTSGSVVRCSILLSYGRLYDAIIPTAGLEPARLTSTDFKSAVSTIPPSGHCLL